MRADRPLDTGGGVGARDVAVVDHGVVRRVPEEAELGLRIGAWLRPPKRGLGMATLHGHVSARPGVIHPSIGHATFAAASTDDPEEPAIMLLCIAQISLK